MKTLPPGPSLLSSNLPGLITPPVVVYLLGYTARAYLFFTFPDWLFITAILSSWPCALLLYVRIRDFRIAKDAFRKGAEVLPLIPYKLPAGLDLVISLRKESRNRILGYRLFEYVEKYGPTFNFSVFFENRVFTTDPECIKKILATEFETFEKGPYFFEQVKDLLGTGVFNSDGELWKFHRGMTRPFFTKDRISHFDIFDRHADEVVDLIKKRMQEGVPIDWQDLMSRFTMDSATEFLFGQNVASLSAPLSYPSTSPLARTKADSEALADRFSNAFQEAQIVTALRSRYTNAWPLFEFWKNKVIEHKDVIDEFIQPLIKRAMEKKAKNASMAPETRVDEVEDDETLLEHLVKLTDDENIIRDETLNILLAGKDTTAIALTMAGYVLAEHPRVLQRLRMEVAEKVGMRRPTYGDIREMKYLRAFINEVLRLYPPVPFDVRYSAKSTVWPSTVPGGKPLYIPAHVRILYSVLVMQRRKDLWGPDAHEFDPDRFLDERLHKYLIPNPYIFVPFNAGPRICLGQQFAYNEMSFLLIRLLQNVSNIELKQEVDPESMPPPGWAESRGTNGKDKVRIKTHITMYIAGGVWLKMNMGEVTEL